MKKNNLYVRNHYLHEIIVSSYKGFIECTSAKPYWWLWIFWTCLKNSIFTLA